MDKGIRIIFFGDLAPIKGIDDSDRETNIFNDIPDLFKSADLVIGNLESPLQGNGDENLLKKPRVIAVPNTFENILKLRPSILCLANNHIYDSLEEGYKRTTDFLKNNDIEYIGAGFSSEEASKSLIVEKNDFKIGVLNYLTKDTNPCLPDDCKIRLNFFDLEQALSDIRNLENKVDIRIVVLHWGLDYCCFPSPRQRDVACALSRAGADIIVGTHAHVIQPVEKIGKTLVAYGLGNFYFPDFIFNNEKRVWAKENKESLILDVALKEKGIDSTKYYKTIQRGNRIGLHKHGICKQIWKLRCVSYFLKWNIIWKIYLTFREKVKLMFKYFFRRERSFVVQLLSIKAAHIKRFFTK